MLPITIGPRTAGCCSHPEKKNIFSKIHSPGLNFDNICKHYLEPVVGRPDTWQKKALDKMYACKSLIRYILDSHVVTSELSTNKPLDLVKNALTIYLFICCFIYYEHQPTEYHDRSFPQNFEWAHQF